VSVNPAVVDPTDEDQRLYQQLLDLLDGRANQLLQQARQLVDDYWIAHTEQGALQQRKNKGYTVPRCRLVKHTLVIEWFNQRTVPAINPKTNRPYVFSNYLPKGREYHYPEAVFQSVARDWELPLIQQYEHLFADLRRRAQVLAQLRLQVRRRLPKPVPERDDA